MEERAQQVSFMGDIYRLSSNNHVNMGENDGTFGSALEMFRNLFEEARRETANFETFWGTVYDTNKEHFNHDEAALATKINTKALFKFYSRPWFERIWVLQGIILPYRSTFHCGAFTIDGSVVLKATLWLEHKSASIKGRLYECQGRHNANDIAYLRFMKGAFEGTSARTWSLKYILAMSTRFKATDPRDKIFGILDLLQSSTPALKSLLGLLAPDYEKSSEKVFRDATTFSIIANRLLQIFRNIYHRGDEALDLEGHASWVPQ
ncbi:hypothetical protein GQ44DRAFT_762175 [Phaeosphaeriaceae sp. PMI808]|nr:hypothetical protein GQ44DRAFT_762175 [Phaeosphaeriaceae sp. PMI808]